MLTKDENIVDVSLTVQWVIDSATSFLVNVRDPRKSLDQATESALRHVVGSSTMDQVITDGREAIAIEVQDRLQAYLRNYGAGIDVTKVNIDRSAPPVQVKDAFNDVQKAKEDQQRFINQATAYSQQIVPEARGRAQRQLEEAQAYRDRVIARSEGEAERFEKLLAEYSVAKQVTRDRLYIDALENVFKNASKVMIDVEGGNNMMYLPLDKLSQRATENGALDAQALRRDLEQLRRDLNSSRSQGGSRLRTN
jgi:membrane protease subunit HflK